MKLPILIVALALSLTILVVLEMNRHEDSPPREFVEAYEVDGLLREHKLIAVKGTGSMAPYIPAGDPSKNVAWVIVEECEFDALKKGDIVVFEVEPYGFILHRLALKTAAGWITSGDHNFSYDSTRVYPENFRGRVTYTYVLK